MTTTAERGPTGVLHEESEFLRPYVPRLVIDWLRTDPNQLHREVEASLVFVDISGFTALTERLSRKGKVGAELMRDTLDGVFTALLDEAYDWGAGLLKWGGDALLLMFGGPGHAWRACRAAWEMQHTIDRVGRLNVSGGTIILTCGARIASPSGCIALVRRTVGLSGMWRRSFDDRIVQAAEALDLDFDGRARLEPRRRLVQGGHAGRRAGCDDVAGFQYLQGGQIGDEIGDVEQHVARRTRLQRAAVDL